MKITLEFSSMLLPTQIEEVEFLSFNYIWDTLSKMKPLGGSNVWCTIVKTTWSGTEKVMFELNADERLEYLNEDREVNQHFKQQL